MASAACILLMVPCFTRRDSTSTSFPARISSTFFSFHGQFQFLHGSQQSLLLHFP